MQKINKIKILTVALLAILPVIAFAQVPSNDGTGQTNLSITSIGLSIIRELWVVFTVIAVVAFIVAGFLFLTAFGEAEKLTKARSAVIWGVVGIIVAILAYGITTIVSNAIGAS